MNNDRRKRIAAIRERLSFLRDEIEDLSGEETASLENMPEGIREGEKGHVVEAACAALEEALVAMDDVSSNLEQASE